MLRKIKQFFKKLFSKKPTGTQPNVKIGDIVDGIEIKTQSQLDKRTDFKIGESYRVGEMIVTLRASKEEVQAIIAHYDKIRAAKEQAKTERGIEIMLMTPEQLETFKIDEYLAKNSQKASFLEKVMSKASPGPYLTKLWGKDKANRYIPPNQETPNRTLDSFKDALSNLDKIDSLIQEFEEATKAETTTPVEEREPDKVS